MHIITGLNQGGAETMLMRLLQGMGRHNISQSVISLTSSGTYGNQVESLGVPLTVLGISDFFSLPRSVVRLRQVIAERKPDLIQTWLYHADLLGLIAARLAGNPPVVWNIRCAALAPGDVPKTTSWLVSLLARLSFCPTAVLFNSVAGQEAHRAVGYHMRQSEVIPNGFDLNEWYPDSGRRAAFRAELGVSGDTFVVGMIARYHRMKNHHCFFAAAARVRSRMNNVRFVLAGTDITWDNRSLVADIEKFGLRRDDIILLGPRHDMPVMMAGLDCLALTSSSEGYPNVLGEAMATGVPCVATDVGDARYIMGDTGRIVAAGDAAGVADGILALMALSKEERNTLAMYCRNRIAENFEINRMTARYADFYNRLVGSK